MNASEILNLRLNSQMLIPETDRTVQELVSRMGAMQAQDYAMMKWAIGCRLPGSTETLIEKALDGGEILRTHVLRPTWHVIPAEDIHWMLELTAQRIRDKMKTRDAQLGLTDSVINKSKRILLEAFKEGNHKTKEEINHFWNRASIPTTEYRDAHLLMHAELDGLICSGRTIGKNRGYALLEERVSHRKHLTKEEALAKLARTYFTSRCPATLRDFVWWSGLSVRDAKLAMDSIKVEFHSEIIGHQTYYIPDKSFHSSLPSDVLHILPAFDEYIIAYKDRSATMIPERFQKVVSNNGVFRPVILINGRVLGIWKRVLSKNRLLVEVEPFEVLSSEIKEKLEKEYAVYGQFLGISTKVRFKEH